MSSRHLALFPPILVVLAVLALATPGQLLAQPAACLAAADLVDTEGFELSPRDDRTAEMLALRYTNDLAADATLFERLHNDLDLFATQFPDVELWEIWRNHDERTILVRFVDQDARDAAEAGENEAFNCLLDLLDSDHTYFFSGPLAVVGFDGRYDLLRVNQLFELIPEVEYSALNHFIWDIDAGCFHSPDGRHRVIFLEEVVIFFPSAGVRQILRIDVDPASGISYEEYPTRQDAPWQAEYEACLDGQLSGDLDPDVLGVLDIPTLSEIGLLMLVLSLLAAGVVRMRSA